MKIFVITAALSLYLFAYFSYTNSPPTEFELWCKEILNNRQQIMNEPLGETLIEVCSSDEHLNVLKQIINE